jgi:hypothetical protein
VNGFFVMPGHSRPKDGVLSHAYVPGIHALIFRISSDVDGRDKPGHDEARAYGRRLRLCLDYAIMNTMMTETESIVLEHLRHIRTAVDSLRDDMHEVKGRLGTLESQYASISNRVDRLDGRVERIERRLNLAEV